MLPTRTPTVGWRASVVRCTESERFCEATGVSIVAGKVCSIRGRFCLFCRNLADARSILILPSAIKSDVMRSCESSTDAGRATLQYLVNY